MTQKTYRIGEAAAHLKLKSYVLRFWETEFPQIAPIRTEKGQRLYTESDLAVLGRIRYLLHERGLTIDGARRLLREEAAKGVSYTDAALSSDENLVDEFLEDVPESANGDTPDMDDNNVPGNAAHPAPEAGNHAPVQAGLFPGAGAARYVGDASLAEGGRPSDVTLSVAPDNAAAVAAALPSNELRTVISELATIRGLLVADTPGERP